jgi:hypothetical protein
MIPIRKVKFMLSAIRSIGHLDFNEIAITYLKYNEFSHIGKIHAKIFSGI